MSQPNGDECAFGHAAENGHCPGITKREWFAGMALQGMLTLGPIAGQDHDIESQVQHCWRLADAMLKQRAATP